MDVCVRVCGFEGAHQLSTATMLLYSSSKQQQRVGFPQALRLHPVQVLHSWTVFYLKNTTRGTGNKEHKFNVPRSAPHFLEVRSTNSFGGGNERH